jgi:hypothetical protein
MTELASFPGVSADPSRVVAGWCLAVLQDGCAAVSTIYFIKSSSIDHP